MFKLILVLTLMTKAYASSSIGCFELKSKDDAYKVQVEREGEQKVTLKLLSESALTLEASCMGKPEELKCLGDDDSASFTLDLSSKKVEVNHLTFGEPDSATKSFLFLKQAATFKITPCDQ